MTDQLMFETWVELLRPQFPQHAEFTYRPRRRTIVVKWHPEDSGRTRGSAAIVFTNLAWKGYRGARSARRSRADANLVALVRTQLAHLEAEHDTAYEPSAAELHIEVASVDLFPPPASAPRGAGQDLVTD